MKILLILSACFAGWFVCTGDFQISSYSGDGLFDSLLTVSNAFTNGIVSILKASSLTGFWCPDRNAFSTDSVAQVDLIMAGNSGFYRAVALDLSGQKQGVGNGTTNPGPATTVALAASDHGLRR